MDFLTTSIVALGLAAGGDAATTEIGVRRAGIVEANPLMRRAETRVALKLAVVVGLPLIEKKYMKDHRRLRIVLNFGIAAGYAAATARNVEVLRW